jgi:hypothetical protein
MVLMTPMPLDLPPQEFRVLIELINESRGKSFGPPLAMSDKEWQRNLASIADRLRPAARNCGLSI